MSTGIIKTQRNVSFDPKAFLARIGDGKSKVELRKGQTAFSQGDTADAIFYVRKGKIGLKVVSQDGKEAVIAILGTGNFFGEGCLVGQPSRMATAVALTECSVMRLDRSAMILVLHEQPDFAQLFVAHLLTRNIRLEDDLVDQLFNSSEKRLARVLLLLAQSGKDAEPQPVILNISQEILAQMVGTTRSRISFFMNKFRRLGFIDYNGGLKVHSSLLNVVLHD